MDTKYRANESQQTMASNLSAGGPLQPSVLRLSEDSSATQPAQP